MKKILVFLLFLMFFPVVSAQYIVGDIYIDETGEASFYVESDVDMGVEGVGFSGDELRGETNLLTSKNGDIWSFSLDLGNYETILLDIHLPSNVDKVFDLNGVDSIFDTEEKIVSLIDNDMKLDFSVSYSLGEESSSFIFWKWILAVVVLVLIYLSYNRKTKTKRKINQAFPFIGDVEKKILDLIVKGPMRQKQVREKLGIPKASFSRYVSNLEKKKLVVREGEGKNKVLRVG